MLSLSSMAPQARLPQLFRSQANVFHQPYLLGLRGILVVQCFLWMFLETFVPATVKTNTISDPTYQVILRKVFAVIFWNDSLIYSTFIILSARMICIPFLHDSTKTNVASSAFRRTIRFLPPVAVAIGILQLAYLPGVAYIDQLKTLTQNTTLQTPYVLPNFLAYFNSIFEVFYVTHQFNGQAANQTFPTLSLWIVSVIYSQSYTLFTTMIIIPYTRSRWRVQASLIFIASAWWVQAWAWYSITGLLFCDLVMNMDYRVRAQRGFRLWPFHVQCPTWVPASVLMAGGLLMMYIWTAWKPDLAREELVVHGGLYYTDGLNVLADVNRPQARVDTWTFLVGFFMFLESSDFLQSILANKVLLYLGDRSFSYFFSQVIIMYTAGARLYIRLRTVNEWASPASSVTTLVVCLATTIVTAEVWHQLVDAPSRSLAHWMFDWVRT